MSQAAQQVWRSALWERLGELHDAGDQQFRDVVVLTETGTTQDDAIGAPVGTIVTTLRQAGGRGRQGRAWADDKGEGIAATFIVPAERSGRLAIAAALAAARAVDAVATCRVGIKWPNDVILKQRKVGGVLVEQDERTARIGIGINVSQQDWPPELRDVAISLAQTGVHANRLELLCGLVSAFSRTLTLTPDELSEQYARFEVLVGAAVELNHRGTRQRGRILDLQPLDAILFEPECGPVRSIPVDEAAIERILEWPNTANPGM